MYISLTMPNEADDVYYKIHFLFLLYRFFSPFLYLILVTVFALVEFESPLVPEFNDRNGITEGRALGLAVLIYAWVASCVWPCVYVCFVGSAMSYPPPRDLAYYVKEKQYEHARALAEFGAVPRSTKQQI